MLTLHAGQPVLVDEILKVSQGVRSAIFGTVYKDMKLKPSILDEYHAREVHLVAANHLYPFYAHLAACLRNDWGVVAKSVNRVLV